MMIMRATKYVEGEMLEIIFFESNRNSNMIGWVDLDSGTICETHKRTFQHYIETGTVVVTGFYETK